MKKVSEAINQSVVSHTGNLPACVADFIDITDLRSTYVIAGSDQIIIYTSDSFQEILNQAVAQEITINNKRENPFSDISEIITFLTNSETFTGPFKMTKIPLSEGYICYNFSFSKITKGDQQEKLEKKLRLALKSSRMGMWEWNMATSRLLWSRETEEIYGLEAGGFDGTMETYFSMIYPEDLTGLQSTIEKALAERTRFEVEHRIIKRDGTIAWVLGRGNCIENETGEIAGMSGTVLDISDKKMIGENLQKSEERFRVVAEQTGQLIYEYQTVTGEIIWSGAIEKNTGYTSEEFQQVGISEWEEMIHPEDRKQALEKLEKAMALVSEYSIFYRFKHKNGHYFYVYDKGIFLTDEKGKASRMLGAMRDITDQVRAEEKIRKSELRYRNLIKNLQIGVMVQAPESKILLMNEAASRIFRSVDSIDLDTLSKEEWEIYDENGKPLLPSERPFMKCLNSRLPVENVVVGIRKVNEVSLSWLLVSSHPMFDDVGRIKEVISTFIDITRQRNFEKALRNITVGVSSTTGEYFFSKLVEYIRDTLEIEFVLVASFNSDKTMLNPLAGIHMGSPVNSRSFSIADSPYFGLISENLVFYPEGVAGQFPQYQGFTEYPVESFLGTTLVDSDGKTMGILAVMSTNPLKDKQVAVYLTKLFAVRAAAELERLHAEKVKSELIEKLIEQNKELQEFSYVLSHSVRAPVATMLGLTSLFDRENHYNAFNSDIINNIGKVATRLDNVIKDLSRSLSMRNLAEFYEEITLADLVKKIKQELSVQATLKKVNFKEDFSTAPVFYSIRKYVYNILFALLDNAVKFYSSEREPQIEISSRYIDRFILITIKDNGVGIDLEKHKNKLFSMYKRFHLQYEGKGLGLYFVKTQINALHGNIEFNSKEQEGTEVKIYLPFQEDPDNYPTGE